jgi:ABC-type transport system substrate-binding protein
MQKSKILIISIIVMSFLCVTISTQYRYSKEVAFQALNTTPKSSQPEGTLKFGTYTQPVTIDPIDGWDSGSFDVIRQVTETLFWKNYSNPSLVVEPLLVESFSWDITNTELTLILKQGIYFHDGQELDAAAVKWNVDRWLYFTNSSGTLPSGTQEAYPSILYFFPDNTPIINSCTVNDIYNLTISLTQPFAPFIEFLSFEANSIISPFSHSPIEYIDLYSGDLIGTGPFTFTQFIPDTEVMFERFELYWRGPSEIATLLFVIEYNSNTRNNMLLAREVHIIKGYNNALLPTFVADPEIHVEFLGTDLNYWYLGFNNFMINRTWREALSYAFNYTYVIENICNEEATRGYPAVPTTMPGHNASVQANLPTMNITYARTIMQSMGFGIGLDTAYPGTNEAEWASASFASLNFGGPLELNAIEDNNRNADINSLASFTWQLIGVDTIEIERTFGDLLNIGYNTPNDLHIWYLGWGPDYIEAYNMLHPLFSSNSDSNFGQVDIPLVNSLLSDAANEIDIPTRLAIYEQLQYILFLQEFVHMSLFADYKYVVHLTNLLNFPYHQLNAFYFYPCSIPHLGPGSFTLTSDAEDPDPILESGITDTNLTLNNFPSGTHYFIVEAVNESGTTLSNCIKIDVLVVDLNKHSPIYDGLFLNYSITLGDVDYGVITVNYTYISGNTFLVNESWSLMPYRGSYEINNQTRQVTNIRYWRMFWGDYTPYWIFSNQSIGDLLYIAVDGVGVHMFNITSETTINLPGIKDFNAWVLKDLSEPNTNALYDKTTGILLNGTFFFYSGTANYTMTLDATNMFDPPNNFILDSTADSPDSDGNFDLTWESAYRAHNYSVYEYSSYITEINGSLTLLGDGITDLSLTLSGYSDGIYYFIVVAHNNYGDTLSNCIEVVVGIPPGDFTLSSNAGTPDDNGNFNLTWTSSDKALTYSVYQYSNYITEINGSLTLLGDGITNLSLALSVNTNGIYYFIVVAHNNYGDTLSNCIDVVVSIPPGDFILSSNAGTPDNDGNFDLTWTSSDRALTYSVYQYSSYISEINGSLTVLGDGITDLSLALSGYTDGTYYFIAVAHNVYGDTLSNCIEVIVQKPGIPGYNLYVIFAAIGIVSAITIRKRRKKKKLILKKS